MIKKIGFIVGLLILGAIIYGTWYISKEVNYTYSYEEQVQKTVCEMVKPEHLIKPCNQTTKEEI